MLRYAIVDRTYEPGSAARLAERGVGYVQLREKALPDGELLALARVIVADIASVRGAELKLLLNARPDIAVAAGEAVGVHLTSRAGELTPRQVREVFGEGAARCVSVACHTVEEVARAHAEGADLVLFGPVFEKRVAGLHIRDGSGLEQLRRACRTAKGTPVLALGGVTEENAGACVEAGAAGIAAIRLFA